MQEITIFDLLRKYKDWAKRGKIQFLEKGTNEQKDVLVKVERLLSDFEEAHKKKGNKDFSEILDWYKVHQKGRQLWETLAGYALSDIDKESKGNSQLFQFLDSATKFEDLLYGLEDYYRDHTLHSLWVYFIGEYILRDLLPNINKNLNWYLFNDIERDKKKFKYPKTLVKSAKDKKIELIQEINKHKDAIWCIMSLCHDLGYSLTKLDELNEKVKNVLSFFELPDFQHIGYSLEIEHQYNVSQFLELMAMDVRIEPSENYRDRKFMLEERVLIKGYRDDSTYWRLCRALEKKKHGILSAYLIYKILGIFADSWLRGPAEKWGLDDPEVIDNIIRGDILYAISQHDFDFAYLNQLNSLADILILADELEEFSRYGREMLSRKYYDTTADVKISFNPENPKKKDNIGIDIEYEAAKHLNLKETYKFFERKATRLCRIYSLDDSQVKLDREKEILYLIRSIKMTVKKDNKEVFFHIFSDPRKNKGYLPKTTIKGKNYEAQVYNLICHDDKIIYVDKEGNEISLKEWIENADHI